MRNCTHSLYFSNPPPFFLISTTSTLYRRIYPPHVVCRAPTLDPRSFLSSGEAWVWMGRAIAPHVNACDHHTNLHVPPLHGSFARICASYVSHRTCDTERPQHPPHAPCPNTTSSPHLFLLITSFLFPTLFFFLSFCLAGLVGHRTNCATSLTLEISGRFTGKRQIHTHTHSKWYTCVTCVYSCNNPPDD